MKVRTAAAKLIAELLRQQGSLASLMPDYQTRIPERDGPLLQELCYGTLRWHPQLNAYLGQLLDKPLKPKDSDIQALLLLGLYQLLYTRIPDHAALGATVECARDLKKPWATRLINGVLRRFQREREALETKLAGNREFVTAHPAWLLKRLRAAWPEDLEAVIAANNSHPPLTLRLNTERESRADYLARLLALDIDASATPYSPYGITVHSPCNVAELPLFAEGGVSVQDEAAQLSGPLLNLAPGQRVLDACCAPGGKTGHILELEPGGGADRSGGSGQRSPSPDPGAGKPGPAGAQRHGGLRRCRRARTMVGRPCFRPHSAGCALLRHRHYPAPAGHQADAQPLGNRQAGATAKQTAGCPLAIARPRRHSGLRHLLGDAGRKHPGGGRLCGAPPGCPAPTHPGRLGSDPTLWAPVVGQCSGPRWLLLRAIDQKLNSGKNRGRLGEKSRRN